MKANEKRQGFTIVELLTVMGVIAILISLLVPALALVRDYSKEIQQKAQFHAIEAGLEMYKAKFGSYPPSNDNSDPINVDPDDPTPYAGANKLAEAIVGLDMLGVHFNTDFRSDGLNTRDDGSGLGTTQDYAVYHATFNDAGVFGLFVETADENIQARKGPFLDLENANVFEMQDVYEVITTVGFRNGAADPSLIDQSLVLCDVFAVKRQSGKKTGMPILYYRARRSFTQQDSQFDSGAGADTYDDDIFFYTDNETVLELGSAENQAIDHPLYGTGGVNDTAALEMFDNMIINTQVTQIRRPFKAGSYILISAGKDGLYGTPDDITNFEKQN